MATTYTRGRIRLLIDVTSREPHLDDVTGREPSIWRGTDLAIEMAFVHADSGLIDVTRFSSITAEVRDVGTRTSALFGQKTVAAADLVPTLTLDQWNAGTGQHGSWIWTKEETNWPLGGSGGLERTFWFVVYGITNDPTPLQVTLGCALLRVVEDGRSAPATTPATGDPLYLTAAEVQAAIGQVVRPGGNAPGMTVLLVSPNGQFGRLIGVDDAGAALDSIVPLS